VASHHKLTLQIYRRTWHHSCRQTGTGAIPCEHTRTDINLCVDPCWSSSAASHHEGECGLSYGGAECMLGKLVSLCRYLNLTWNDSIFDSSNWRAV